MTDPASPEDHRPPRTAFLAMEDAVLVIRGRPDGGRWGADRTLDGASIDCIAASGAAEGGIEAWTATRESGVLGYDPETTWAPVRGRIPGSHVTALASEPGRASVLVGTEPSAVYRLAPVDGRLTPLGSLEALPSSTDWSFPPRPQTHHVRDILGDPSEDGVLHVAVEAGALVRSTNHGERWRDRVPTGPRDTHQMAVHDGAPGRLYIAAGDGYFRSPDRGDTWSRPREGLVDGYLWSVAVDAADPDLELVSAAPDARSAHDFDRASTRIYRRHGHGWEPLSHGLPPSEGTTIPSLAADPDRSEAFWLGCNHGVYVTTDAGASWQPASIPWPDRFRSQRVRGLVVV